VSATEARLAALCAAAGYSTELVELIAEATFARHKTGETLSEPQLRQLAEAVKMLAAGERSTEHIPVLVDEYEARHGDRWREVFWTRTIRAAAFRAACREGHPHQVPAPGLAQANGRANTARAQQARSAQTRPA